MKFSSFLISICVLFVLPAFAQIAPELVTQEDKGDNLNNAVTPNSPPQQAADNTTVRRRAVLTFTDSCWVNFTSDNGDKGDFIAEPGHERVVYFSNYFSVDIGNASAVSVNYRDNTISGLGSYRQPVRGVYFVVDDNGTMVMQRTPPMATRYTVNTVFAQDLPNCQYRLSDLEKVNNMMIVKSTGQPADGILCTYYDNRNIEFSYSIKQGKRNGISRSYSESGKLESETPYKNGKMEGISRTYYESGKLQGEMSFKHGVIEGTQQHYNENGRLWGTILYKNDEIISGTCGDGRQFTNAELLNWENGHTVSCDYE